MHIALVQPPYPGPGLDSRQAYAAILTQLAALPAGLDLVVLPEYSNCPGIASRDELLFFIRHEAAGFTDFLSQTALEKNTCLAANLVQEEDGRLYNRTLLLDQNGQQLASYNKCHLTEAEKELGLSWGDQIVVAELGDLKIGFLTCFDVYFPEFSERLAQAGSDLLIFPSYQRFEDPSIIKTQAAALAVQSGAFVARAAYAMPDGKTGGQSMLVDPQGKVLVQAGQEAGLFSARLDLATPSSYRARLEQGRRPHLYRPAGPGALPNDYNQPYPRLCAHRGLARYCPENSLAAFGAAVAMGADEIELDVVMAGDGQLIVSHDDDLSRLLGQEIYLSDLDWEAIRQLELGNVASLVSQKELGWQNIAFCRLDDVLAKLAGRVIFNIEIKQYPRTGPIRPTVAKVIQLLYQYGAEKHAYIAGHKDTILAVQDLDPGISICCMEGQAQMTVVENALLYGCQKVQFFRPGCTPELPDKIRLAKENGIICNYCCTDDPEEAKELFSLGIDCILTNDLGRLQAAGPLF